MNSQGQVTNTVLTNLSNYLTVVSDEPYCTRKLQRHGLPALRSRADVSRPGRRGLRPLHRTTLNLDVGGEGQKMTTSTMKESFGGKQNLRPVKPQMKCPSQHLSQIEFGQGSHNSNMNTTNWDFFKNHTGQLTTLHGDRVRWRNQMSGRNMMRCTRYDDSQSFDFGTTYSQSHRQLLQNYSESDHLKARWRTSIYSVCGEFPRNNTRSFGSVSGNRILHEMRKSSLTNVLC